MAVLVLQILEFNQNIRLYCARLPDNQECHELRYKRLRKGLKDATKATADNHHYSSSSLSSEAKNAGRSCGGNLTAEHKEASTSSHGAGIACNAMLLGSSGRPDQQQQRPTAGVSSLQQRLADLSQSLSNSVDVQSAPTVSTDLAALLEMLTAAVNRPTL